MSGDVQPRKRKDKKRKKDDSAEHIPTQPHTPPSSLNEDINIHVHKEEGTGGGICAKIIFFLLFTALAVCIGLIITEHRGLTDLETTEQESRFSHLFEGWIDNSIGHDDHDDEGDHVLSTEDHEEDHDEELPSHEGHDDDDEEHDDDDEEHDDYDENDEGEEEEEETAEVSEEIAQSEEEDDEEEEPTEASDEVPRTEEDEDEEEEEDEATAEDEDEEEEEEEEEQNVSELDSANEEGSEENDNNDEDDEEVDSKPDKRSVEHQEDDNNDEEDIAASKDVETPESEEKEIDDDNKDDATSKEDKEDAPENKDEELEDEEQNSKLVVKIGVGVALLVVAHVVLVRKWKSAAPADNVTKDEIPDLSRRNTIIVPPSFQEVKEDMEAEEEYSDEDGEVDSDEETEVIKSPKKYKELRTTYARSLTPESEPEYQNKTELDENEYDEEIDDEEDEEEEEDEEDDELDTGYEKDDDEELLERLEAKYGKLQGGINVIGDNEAEESESDKQSDPETYEYENITNKDDFKIKEKIDEAHKNIQNNTAYTIKLFDVLLEKYPFSPRSLYGKAQALELLADQKRSNQILQKAISIYTKILTIHDVPDALFEAVAQRCINRMRFIGNYHGAIDVHQKLIARFPEVIKHKNQLVVSYLTINRVHKARVLLKEILAKYPNDGFALVHYGFIVKTVDNKLNESILYLQKGIATKDPGVIDGRFYFHLGDALSRLGKVEEAMKVYEDGVKNKLFLSKYQRSLYNVDRLKGQPWWKKEETPYLDLFRILENNWKKIREEGISVLNKDGLFQHESENLKDTGDWKQFEMFARGQKNINNCKKCPFTCKIIENIPDATGCKRGQIKFSVMHPSTHVWPHCGPTNCRLRVHLGLKVPENTFIRVADEIRSWEEGKVLIFDDSFEHEVWHNGTSFRLVLIVDVWHPELTSREKRNLSPI